VGRTGVRLAEGLQTRARSARNRLPHPPDAANRGPRTRTASNRPCTASMAGQPLQREAATHVGAGFRNAVNLLSCRMEADGILGIGTVVSRFPRETMRHVPEDSRPQQGWTSTTDRVR
jgi:hypothetical protein